MFFSAIASDKQTIKTNQSVTNVTEDSIEEKRKRAALAFLRSIKVHPLQERVRKEPTFKS